MSCPFTDHPPTLDSSPESFTRDHSGAVELFGPNYRQDPYHVFKQLNEVGAIHRVRFPSGVHAWLVAGAAAAEDLLHHPDIRKNHEFGNAAWRAKASIMPEPQHTRLQSHLLHQDAAVHAGMRRLIVPAFQRRPPTQ